MRVVGATLLALSALAVAAPAADPTRQELLAAVEKRLKAAADKVGPCAACVVVSRSDRYPKAADGGPPGKLGGFDLGTFLKDHPGQAPLAVSLDLSNPVTVADHGHACGVVIDAAGLVLTPYHVVEGATKVYVHLPGRGGSYADIHAADSRSDLAVLKLINPPPKLTAVKFAEVRLHEQRGKPASVQQGTLTVLVASGYVPGFPLDKPSVALGSVTAVRYPRTAAPDRSASYYTYGPLIEHDAKLNVGVDGAALLNLDGELIGLATSAAHLAGTERGPFRAFPADDNFRRVVEVLRRGEEVEYGFLGVSLPRGEENTPRLSDVTPGGPADLAGLQPGDVITRVDGVPIQTYEDLLAQVGPARAGRPATLTILRGGRARDAVVVLGKFRNTQPFVASVRPEPVFGLRVDYGSILAQPANGGRAGGVPAGVTVREVVPDSPAAKALGERPERWLVTRVNGGPVATPAEFYKAAKGQKSITLTLRDPGEPGARDREVTLP
jgi:serine protease Do